MSVTVQDLLRGKSAVYSVGPDDTVYDALRLMADKNIGAVIVQSDQHVEGIFSERDYARKVMLIGKTSRQTLVSEIMTPTSYAQPDWTVDQCMALMTEKRIRHLPVMEEGAAGRRRLDRRCGACGGRGAAVHDQLAAALHHVVRPR